MVDQNDVAGSSAGSSAGASAGAAPSLKGGVAALSGWRKLKTTTVAGLLCAGCVGALSGGATVALMTDSWLSPIADVARHVLPARVDSASPFDSAVAATALTESLVAAVTEALGDVGMQRVAEFESHAELRAGAIGDA